MAALFMVEAAFFADPWSRWRGYAGLSWIACSVAVILSAWTCAFARFFESGFWKLPDRAWYLVAFFVPPTLVLVNGGGVFFTSVDGEGLQQLGNGLYYLHNDPGYGVFRMAYFNYPARQFVLNCLPAYLFGTNLWAARVGTSMFYIGSYLFFLSALADYLRRCGVSRPLFFASFCAVLIAFNQYTLLNARKFEQTIMPVGITLFFLAALMLFVTRPGPLRLLWVTWAIGFFPECYTPAVGSWVLALAILLYFAIGRKRAIFLPAILYGIICLWVAYKIVHDEDSVVLSNRFQIGLEHFTATDWVYRYAYGITSIIGADFALVPAPLALIILAGVYLSWRYRDWRFPSLCLWALAIIVLSLMFRGSNLNSPRYDVHRAIIILAPLAIGATFLLIRFLAEAQDSRAVSGLVRFFMGLSMAYMVFAGACTVLLVRAFPYGGFATDYDEAFAKINDLVNSPVDVRPTRIYVAPPLDLNLESGLRFFGPEVKVIHASPPAGERIPGAYVLSYIAKDPEERVVYSNFPSLHPRPYLRLAAE